MCGNSFALVGFDCLNTQFIATLVVIFGQTPGDELVTILCTEAEILSEKVLKRRTLCMYLFKQKLPVHKRRVYEHSLINKTDGDIFWKRLAPWRGWFSQAIKLSPARKSFVLFQ